MKVWVLEYESDIVVLVYLCDSKGKDKLGKSQFFFVFVSSTSFLVRRQI